MDEHDYFEKFRLAILWDEFKRREFPKEIGTIYYDWRTHYRNRLVNRYRKPSHPLPLFDWLPLAMYGGDIQWYILRIWDNDYDDKVIFSLRHNIWQLEHALVEVRNANILDYYEHLLYIAQEVLQEVDKGNRSG